MPTSVITNTITDPGGTPLAGVTVTARLVPGAFFRTTEGTELALSKATTTDANGAWSLTLERNSNITPTGSYYEVEERLPVASGGIRSWAISVGAANQSLKAALVALPPSVTGPTYITQDAADARYQQLGALGGSVPARVSDSGETQGVSTAAARADHDHQIATGGVVAASLATSLGRLHLVATVAARDALTGLREGDMADVAANDLQYRYTGSAWVPLSGQVIAFSELGASATSVAFTSLNQEFRHLAFEVSARGTAATTAQLLQVRWEGIATATYDSARMWNALGVASPEEDIATTYARVGVITAANADGGNFGHTFGTMLDYLSPNSGIAILSTSGAWVSAADNGAYVATILATERDGVGPVDSWEFFPESGSFAADSMFTIRGTR